MYYTKTNKLSFGLLIVLFFGLFGVSQAASTITQGSNYVVFEADDHTSSDLGEWVLRQNGDAEYLGDGIGDDYLEFTGNKSTTGSPNSPLVYKFTAPSTGIYQLSMRMYQNLEEDEESDIRNDVYVRLSGDFTSANAYSDTDLAEDMKFWGRAVRQWGSLYKGENGDHTKLEMVYNLKEGEEYTLTMSGRSQGTCIDYIIFYESSLSYTIGVNKDISKINDEEYLPPVGDSEPVEPVEQTPYSGTPIELPGIIQAQDFDNGGEGVAYHDTDTENKGDAYRTSEGVDIQETDDTSGDYNIGWIQSGEWLEYTVNVLDAGIYDFTLRAAAKNANSVEVSLGTTILAEELAVINTGDYKIYEDVVLQNVELAEGVNVLKIKVLADNVNINYMEFAKAGTTAIFENSFVKADFSNELVKKTMFTGDRLLLSKNTVWKVNVYDLSGAQVLQAKVNDGVFEMPKFSVMQKFVVVAKVIK